jgi:hypothetical protein
MLFAVRVESLATGNAYIRPIFVDGEIYSGSGESRKKLQ